MDFDNREKLQELVQFESSAAEPGEYVSLRQYVDRMPSAQQEIYYICADSRNTAANSPVLEAFRKREFEVLYFIDPIDEFLVQNLTEYDDKKLRAIDKGEVDLEGEEGKEERQKARQEAADKFKDLLEHIQQALKEQIKEVRLSNRLTESASCLVADEHAMSAHMERLFKAMNQDVPQTKRILELNPEHRILSIMQSLLTAARNDKLDDYCWLLYDQALLTEGTQIQDTARFTRVVTDLMVRDGEAQS